MPVIYILKVMGYSSSLLSYFTSRWSSLNQVPIGGASLPNGPKTLKVIPSLTVIDTKQAQCLKTR